MNYNEYFNSRPKWLKELLTGDNVLKFLERDFSIFIEYPAEENFQDVRQWCLKNIGKEKTDWFYLAGGIMCFKTKKDCIRFKIEWIYGVEVKNWINDNNVDLETEEGQMLFKLKYE